MSKRGIQTPLASVFAKILHLNPETIGNSTDFGFKSSDQDSPLVQNSSEVVRMVSLSHPYSTTSPINNSFTTVIVVNNGSETLTSDQYLLPPGTELREDEKGKPCNSMYFTL